METAQGSSGHAGVWRRPVRSPRLGPKGPQLREGPQPCRRRGRRGLGVGSGAAKSNRSHSLDAMNSPSWSARAGERAQRSLPPAPTPSHPPGGAAACVSPGLAVGHPGPPEVSPRNAPPHGPPLQGALRRLLRHLFSAFSPSRSAHRSLCIPNHRCASKSAAPIASA